MAGTQVRFLGGQYIHQLVNYNIMNCLLKINDGGDRAPNCGIPVVWSASYASGNTLEFDGSISSSSFHVQLLFVRF